MKYKDLKIGDWFAVAINTSSFWKGKHKQIIVIEKVGYYYYPGEYSHNSRGSDYNEYYITQDSEVIRIKKKKLLSLLGE